MSDQGFHDATLGCVLAGGQSSRFGSDKALALFDGETLLDRAIATLGHHCDTVVVAGRDAGISDWPRPGMGPLGGISGALRYASSRQFSKVLTCGVDSLGLPDNLPTLLSPAPSCLAAQPVVGLWPIEALPALEAILTGDGRHSVLRFADAIGARLIDVSKPPSNVNTPADLARLPRRLPEN